MEIEVRRGQRVPEEVESLLRSLPAWFGIEEALMGYAADACSNDTYTAVSQGRVVAADAAPNTLYLTRTTLSQERCTTS